MLAGNAVGNPACVFIMSGEFVKIIGIVGIPVALMPLFYVYGDDRSSTKKSQEYTPLP